MALRAVREQIAQDLGTWLADGLISAETHDLLRERYAAHSFGFASAVKYLGAAGAFMALCGLLGLVAALSGSEAVAALFLLLVGAGLTRVGIRLGMDRLARYPSSSKLLAALGVFVASAGIGVALDALGAPPERLTLITLAFVVPLLGLLAYRLANTWLLVLALLGFFHAVGAFSAMWGRATYVVAIDDERAMCAAALAVIGVGVHHELYLRASTGRFYQVYEVLGLVYLNLSLLILTLHDSGGPSWFWIVVFALLGLLQLMLGARLHSGVFSGFGVTALAINLYTRYFELFWEQTHAGVFFLLGGLSLLAAGIGCELALKRLRARSA
jgi:hypothetical protein